MSLSQWGGLVEDWSHAVGDRDDRADQERGELEELDDLQEEMEYSVYADSSMTIPGQGEKGPNCGIWKPAEFCDECANVGYAQNRCERRSCPNCDLIWTKERAKGIAVRTAAARYAEEDGIDRREIHVVVSAPAGAITTLQEVYDGYREAYELAGEKGVRGGVAIFHGFRVTEEVKTEYREADPDMGLWAWIREERGENWRTLTYWSPHYHILGLCREFEADDPENQEGWVARRIRSLKPYSGLTDMEAYEDMVGAARYLLSHATFEPETQRDCVRWFGELATTKFRPDEEVSEGALETIERKVEEVVGMAEEEGEGEEEADECEECGARSWSPIWEAGAALMDSGWVDRIGRKQERRLHAAFEWAIGDRKPPPGMKRPRTEEEAIEGLEAILAR